MTPAPPLELNHVTHFTMDVGEFKTIMLHAAIARSLAQGGPGMPFYRRRQVAAHIDPARLLEQYALYFQPRGWHMQRANPVSLFGHTAEAVLMMMATGTVQHCTMSFRLWAATPELADGLTGEILAKIEPWLIPDTVFSLDWRYSMGGGLSRTVTMERPEDALLEEAYPGLREGVAAFIDRYLDTPESVLVLQGPPGMGKTRLVREILRRMSVRKRESGKFSGDIEDAYASALYSGDQEVWEHDAIFAEFLDGEHEALLIEDADHLLTPRANGNRALHRFLNISDGISRTQGRKIIFSTNLPNVRDLDDALVRPGRCFGHLHLRHLTRGETQQLLSRLCDGNKLKLEAAGKRLDALQKNHYSVADVYAAQVDLGTSVEAPPVGTVVRATGTAAESLAAVG